ncbi:MAG: hypothetical protein Ct9H90mP16_07780 [Candidatus Poseidoniales archaeon]|nr:MAG: hypothetical protein Ct9H90mP16_07780 [Candidatus Poseidoniales archaeon]
MESIQFGGSTSASPAPTRSFSTPQSSAAPSQTPRGPPSRLPWQPIAEVQTPQSRGPPKRSQASQRLQTPSRPSGPPQNDPSAWCRGKRPSGPAKPAVAKTREARSKDTSYSKSETSPQPGVERLAKPVQVPPQILPLVLARLALPQLNRNNRVDPRSRTSFDETVLVLMKNPILMLRFCCQGAPHRG